MSDADDAGGEARVWISPAENMKLWSTRLPSLMPTTTSSLARSKHSKLESFATGRRQLKVTRNLRQMTHSKSDGALRKTAPKPKRTEALPSRDWKKRLHPASTTKTKLSDRWLTLDEDAVLDRISFCEEIHGGAGGHKKLAEVLDLTGLSMRKLQWCHVPPLTWRAPEKEKEAPVEEATVAERKVYAKIPMLQQQSWKSLRRQFKAATDGHDFSSIMMEEEQLAIIGKHMEDEGEWFKTLMELHTFHSSKSVPVTAMSCNEVISMYKEVGVVDGTAVTQTYLSQLFVATNVMEANRIAKQTGKRPIVDNTLDLKELVALNIHVAIKRFRTDENQLSAHDCLQLLFDQHLIPSADAIVDADDFRHKLSEQNTDYQTPGDIKEIFGTHKAKLRKIFKAYAGGTVDLNARDDEALDLDETCSLCKELKVFDDKMTKRAVIRPFALCRDMNSRDEDVQLKWVSYIEFITRLGCMKYGTDELAVLAGSQNGRLSSMTDDGDPTIEGCMLKFLSHIYK